MAASEGDVEMQQHTTQRPNDSLYGDKERHRVADLECLFGLPVAKLAPWVGASAVPGGRQVPAIAV